MSLGQKSTILAFYSYSAQKRYGNMPKKQRSPFEFGFLESATGNKMRISIKKVLEGRNAKKRLEELKRQTGGNPARRAEEMGKAELAHREGEAIWHSLVRWVRADAGNSVFLANHLLEETGESGQELWAEIAKRAGEAPDYYRKELGKAPGGAWLRFELSFEGLLARFDKAGVDAIFIELYQEGRYRALFEAARKLAGAKMLDGASQKEKAEAVGRAVEMLREAGQKELAFRLIAALDGEALTNAKAGNWQVAAGIVCKFVKKIETGKALACLEDLISKEENVDYGINEMIFREVYSQTKRMMLASKRGGEERGRFLQDVMNLWKSRDYNLHVLVRET